MVSIDRADPVIMGHILAQHRELHALVAAVRHAFAAQAGLGDAAAIRAGLATLHEHLRAHFHQEEEGGYLEESIARMPRLSAATQAVLDDHPRLLEELARLMEAVSAAEMPAAAWDRADRDYEQFVEHLMEHERNENAVVQEGYNEDLGFG